MSDESLSNEGDAVRPEPAIADGGDRSQAVARPEPARRRKIRAAVRAFHAGLPIEGTIARVIRGGYEIRIGPARAFCPHSHLDLHRIENPEEHVGKTYSFRVLELRRGGEDVVLSRRALLEEERAEEAKAVRATLLEGAVMRGRVARIVEFGAFVDLGAGVTGLVHVSELSYGRPQRPSEAVEVGEWVWVKILKLDEDTGRISLSIRLAQEDPWKDAGSEFERGRAYTGTVRRLTELGAFVELRPGVEAFAPAHEFPPSRAGWSDGLEPGLTTQWLVLSAEPERRRLTVIPRPEDGYLSADAPLGAGARLSGRVQRVEPAGLRVWIGPGRVATVPLRWVGVPRPEDAVRRFPVGSDVRLEIVEVSAAGRIECGIEGVARDLPASEPPQTRPREDGARSRPAGSRADRQEPAPPAAFGTSLGDALRAALGQREWSQDEAAARGAARRQERVKKRQMEAPGSSRRTR